MRYVEAAALADTYDVVAIGSGFGSLFFLKGFLRQRPKARVLILEWGRFNSHQWQIENHRNSDLSGETLLDNRSGKPWLFTIGVGGGTNCWWAQTPRLHPADFEMQTRYGVGKDWPISYNDLVPYYVEAEQIILVAGPDDLSSVWPALSAATPQHDNSGSSDESGYAGPSFRGAECAADHSGQWAIRMLRDRQLWPVPGRRQVYRRKLLGLGAQSSAGRYLRLGQSRAA
jgi:choline dehydrogenase-like flavoprotein